MNIPPVHIDLVVHVSSATDPDWTCDSAGGSNSSDAFERLSAEIEVLIRQDAARLMSGRANDTARLILAQLAHRWHLSPGIDPTTVEIPS